MMIKNVKTLTWWVLVGKRARENFFRLLRGMMGCEFCILSVVNKYADVVYVSGAWCTYILCIKNDFLL